MSPDDTFELFIIDFTASIAIVFSLSPRGTLVLWILHCTVLVHATNLGKYQARSELGSWPSDYQKDFGISIDDDPTIRRILVYKCTRLSPGCFLRFRHLFRHGIWEQITKMGQKMSQVTKYFWYLSISTKPGMSSEAHNDHKAHLSALWSNDQGD